jgi:hypothetical protein
VVPDPAALPGFVPVPATPVLDTALGSGAGSTAGCRLLAGRALYPRVVVPGAPADARWAVMGVRSTSNAPAQLLGWSSGGPRPTGLLHTPIGTTTGTLLVPLASDGTVGLATTLGAAPVAAQVLGYVRGDPVLSPAVPVAPATSTAPAPSVRASAPRAVRASSTRRAVTTRWKAPRRAGDSAIVGYQVQALTSKARGAAVAGTCTAGAKERRCTIRGLKPGKRYWMSVSVANAAGSTWAKRRPVRVR